MQDFLAAELFDVLYYKEKSKVSVNHKREYSALSFRTSSENVRFLYNGKSLTAESNTVCYVPKGAEYKRFSEKDELIVFHFNETTPVRDEIIIFKSDDVYKYQHLFVEAEKIWREKNAGYRYKAASIFYEILAMLTEDGMLLSGNTDADIYKAIDIIEQNFDKADFRVDEISKKLFISETFLRRKFKKYIGKSPKEYLTDRRIDEAKKLLESGYFSQKEISEKCGFSDVKYFRTAFKSVTGTRVKDFIAKESK